ncbi:MAG: DMT family transporter [Burkholderiales bacterium]|nr:MAG: DMT family transporter [Burkholderiales bacterium]
MPRWVGIGLLLLIAVMFGSNHIAARIAFDHGTSVVTAVALRSTGTALGTLALLRLHGITLRLPAATVGRALAIGLVLSFQSYCLYSAVARIPVALALLVFNTFPMQLALISWAAGGERPARRAVVAIPIALLGLAFALDVAGLAPGTPVQGSAFAARWDALAAGVGFAAAGAFAFALVLYLTTRWLGAVDGRLRSCLLMATVAVTVSAIGAATDAFALPADGAGWIGLLLLTVLYGSGITALFVVLPRLGAVNNAAVMNFEPIAVLFLAWPILGQPVAAIQVVGAMLVVGAVVLIGTGR